MPTTFRRSSRTSRFAGIALLVGSALAVAVHTWFATSLLLPLTRSGAAPEYLFLGAPLWLPAVVAPAVIVILTAIHRRWIARSRPPSLPEGSYGGQGPDPWSYDALDYLAPLTLLAIAPLAGVALIPSLAWKSPVVLYVLVDLRVWWTCAIVAATVARFDSRLGSHLRHGIFGAARRLSPRARLLALDAALLLGLMTWAVVSTPHLRFTGILHGDEPKYIRYCESFYQGLGVEVGRQREFSELTLAYSPPVWRNASHFASAVPGEARNLVQDFKTLLRDPGFAFNRGKYADAWFLIGKDGGFYQVHNPGLSALLFPAYFLDRHFIATSPGYQRVFAGELPVTNCMLLVIWAIWGVVIFRLLLASTGRAALSWWLGAAAMLSMPVAAFPFQIYPETTGGLIVTALALWLLFGRPDEATRARAAAAGAAAALLPWLHVRMVVLSVVLFVWAMIALRRRRVAFAALFVAVIGALCLATRNHLTGSLRPDSMYATEGGPSPWTWRFALESAAATPFDRIWGFFPHAPVYLLSIAGWAPMFRAQPRVAGLLMLLIAALVVPTAGHGFSAAGATPLRQNVAVLPLAMVAVAWTWMAWGHRRWVRVAFALLLVLSLDASWSVQPRPYQGDRPHDRYGDQRLDAEPAVPLGSRRTLGRVARNVCAVPVVVGLCAVGSVGVDRVPARPREARRPGVQPCPRTRRRLDHARRDCNGHFRSPRNRRNRTRWGMDARRLLPAAGVCARARSRLCRADRSLSRLLLLSSG